MKIDYISDVHIDSWITHFPNKAIKNMFVPSDDANVCLFAGDAGNGKHYYDMVLDALEPYYAKVLAVPGNHEYYGSTACRTESFKSNWWTSIEDKKIAGCTLWTNFRNDFNSAMIAQQAIGDFRQIIGMTHHKMMEWHEEDKAFLGTQTDADVWLTHFCPFLESEHIEYADTGHLNPYFVNNMGPWFNTLEHKPKVIVHGHTHKSMDYMIGDTRVLSNPIGYAGEEIMEPIFKMKTFEI